MNKQNAQLLLPAPDMNRWVFYRKKQSKSAQRPMTDIYGFSTYTTLDLKNIDMSEIEKLWEDLFGDDSAPSFKR